jgi:hypothetical protein
VRALSFTQPSPGRPAARLGLALVLAWTVVAPAPARAVAIADVRITRVEDHVTVSLRTMGVLSPRVRDSLERGMPATVRLTVELWRVRPGWFDQQVRVESSELRIARNAWSDEFQMRRQAGPLVTLIDLDETERELSRPTRVRLHPVANLLSQARYYTLVRVEVKPLSVEDIEEVERWLSGEAERAGKPGPGSIARLPASLVRMLANLSGFGDETATVRTGNFTRAALEAPARRP